MRELSGRGRAGRARVQPLRAFAEASYSHKLDFDDAPTFARRSRTFLERYTRGPGWGAARTLLVRELRLAESAADRLRGMPNAAFADQAEPFLAATKQAAGTGRAGTELLAAERPALTVRRTRRGFAGRAAPPDPDRAGAIRATYRDGVTATKANRRFVYGWRGGTAFEVPPYAVPDNLMDTYFDRVDELDADYQERADRAATNVTVTLNGKPVRASRGRIVRPRPSRMRANAHSDRRSRRDHVSSRPALPPVAAKGLLPRVVRVHSSRRPPARPSRPWDSGV